MTQPRPHFQLSSEDEERRARLLSNLGPAVGRSVAGDDTFLSTREVALLFRVSPATVRRWADAGKIDSHRTPGGHHVFPLSSLASAFAALSSAGDAVEPTSQDRPSTRRRTRARPNGGRSRLRTPVTDYLPTATRPLRYLITGGAGFIGSHLADALLDAGHRVVALDNLSTGRLPNIAHLEAHPRFRFVQGSVMDELAVDEVVRDADVAVHLAAAVGVRLIVEQPLRSLLTNIRGSEVVLGACHRYGRKVLLASTSEIYGKNSSGPLPELSDRVLGSPAVARWAYSASKGVDEILAFAYHKERGLPTVVARLFNTVGPRQTGAYGMVLPRFAHQAVRGEPLTVYGDGEQSRCFLHVADACRALCALLDDPRAEGDVFNVGSIEEVTILEVARRVIAAAGSSSEVSIVPYEEAYEAGFEDMRRRVPDISKIRSLVGWEPKLTLDEIIEEVVAEARAFAGVAARADAQRADRA